MIETHDLCLNIQDKPVLSNINLTVNQGDYLVIVGPNGSGKSTLLKALIGMLPFQSGDIRLNSKSITHFKKREIAKQMSFVPQENGRHLPYQVEEFVKLSRYSYHNALSEWTLADKKAVDEALDITNTQSFKHRQMSSLSGGECQRVMIAAALSQQTPLILLDEPTSYLDPHHQVEIHQLITSLNTGHNITVVEVTHDINHAAHNNKHVVALESGELLWQGKGDALLDASLLKKLYKQSFVFVTHPSNGRQIALADD